MDDPAAALLRDGRIVALGEEERFIRVKHGVISYAQDTFTTNEEMSPFVDVDVRFFPRESIRFCLRVGGLKWSDLDVVCLAFDVPAILRERTRYARGFPGLTLAALRHRFRAFRDYVRRLTDLCHSEGIRLVFVRHHLAHTAGALFSSEMRRAMVLTMDGMGEFDSARLSTFNGSELETLRSSPLPHSLGRVYSSTTSHLGFRSNREEEKVMALAGYGSPRYLERFRRLVRPTNEGFRIEPSAFWNRECNMGFARPSTLAARLGVPPRPPPVSPLDPPYPDLAASLQEILFEISSHLCRILFDQSGYHDLCLAGGVALNCENNGRLVTQTDMVRDLWVQPQAGDAGTALGAAYWVHFEETGARPEPMRHAYYGRGYSDAEIESLLRKWKLPYEPTSDVAGVAAEEIANGRIVGWFQGASEAGPRALGARSLLALPGSRRQAQRMNDNVKHRERWRPFSPSLCDEDRKHFLLPDLYVPFMTVALPVRSGARSSLRGVTHVTGTTRAQTVRKEANPEYHRLLRRLARSTGTSAVLNTSFNVAGEPIVDHPREAVLDFFSTGIDVLAIGHFVLRKDSSSRSR